MKLKSPKVFAKVILILTFFWLTLTLAIGVWWLYLILKLGNQIPGNEGERVANMILWEGSFFFLLLILSSGALAFFYLRHVKQTRSMQIFFLSLTHELKTPLASIRLQAEVLQEKLSDIFLQNPNAATVMQRLIGDTMQLENKMDKILQLSQLERDSELMFEQIDLQPFIESVAQKWANRINVKIDAPTDCRAFVDEFAFELVLRNLLENTQKHNKNETVSIKIKPAAELWEIQYRDGSSFSGDITKLATIFYKHQSPRGSGIGLYLSRSLMQKMGGNLLFSLENNLFLQTLMIPKVTSNE
jgi:signal transduction histidine kinase